VAATIPKLRGVNDFLAQREALSKAAHAGQIGARQVGVPVALCVSKADMVKDHRYEGYPAIVPGSDDYLGDPWNAVETFFPNDLANMKKLVPHLKVEWVSSTGDNFQPERGIGKPMGIASVFRYVIGNPPPHWAMSSRAYDRLRRFFRV
jgi:hypothetical protein